MPNPSFCSRCGTSLKEGARFCPSCGKPLQQPDAPTPSPAAAEPSRETVIGVIAGAMRRSGFLGLKYEPFVIVLTPVRILFAAQTSDMMKERVNAARDQAKQQGKGFFGQWGAQFQANTGQEYLHKSPQFILTEQPVNFSLNLNQLRSIRMWESDSGGEDSTTTYYIEFDTTAGKHKFSFGMLNIRKLRSELQQYYGSIVR